MPASSAISLTVVAWKPFLAKSSAASLTRCSRRSEASAGEPFARRRLTPSPLVRGFAAGRPLLVLVVVTLSLCRFDPTACSCERVDIRLRVVPSACYQQRRFRKYPHD